MICRRNPSLGYSSPYYWVIDFVIAAMRFFLGETNLFATFSQERFETSWAIDFIRLIRRTSNESPSK